MTTVTFITFVLGLAENLKTNHSYRIRWGKSSSENFCPTLPYLKIIKRGTDRFAKNET